MKISLYPKKGSKESRNALLGSVSVLLITLALSLFGIWMKKPAGGNLQGSLMSLFSFAALFLAFFFFVNAYNQRRARKYEMEYDDK